MFGVAILTIIPTILAYIFLSKKNFKIKSKFLEIALCWFSGQYIFTIITFIIACFLSLFTSNLLYFASLITLSLAIATNVYFYKETYELINKLNIKIHKKNLNLPSIFIILFCLIFSYFLFTPNLAYKNQSIYTSPIYWDLHWHGALIQNFVIGDNFPPENEAFANIPHTYHYMWGVQTGIYESLGLNFVNALNFFSIITFFFILITIIGICEEFFKSKKVGFVTVILFLTSSSLHFIDYFKLNKNQPLSEIFINIITNRTHPWYSSFTSLKHSFYYNGTFFNLFYFIEERQLIIGVLYLLLAVFLIFKREQISNRFLPLLGFLMGAFFLWHLHIAIIVLLALLFLVFFDNNRKKTLLILSGFLVAFSAHVLYFKLISQSPWFIKDSQNFPKLNPGFSDQENKPFSFIHALNWYLYSYGVKIFFFLSGLFLIFKKKRKVFWLILSIVIPTFILLNTIQFSPGPIYENHKFLRPMNIFIDIAAAYAFYVFFLKRKNILYWALGIICIILLTLSGFIELMPFLNSEPNKFYTQFPSNMSTSIKLISRPKDVFTGIDEEEIQISGRKLFQGDILGQGLGLDKQKRVNIKDQIYSAADKKSFCFLTQSNEIDFVELDKNQQSKLSYLPEMKYFPAINISNEQVIFVDVKKSCRN